MAVGERHDDDLSLWPDVMNFLDESCVGFAQFGLGHIELLVVIICSDVYEDQISRVVLGEIP